MKMKCEVLSAASAGNTLKLTLQGRQVKSPPWKPWCSLAIDIPATDKSQAAFHVGRRVIIELRTE